jgi:hypothetical protein
LLRRRMRMVQLKNRWQHVLLTVIRIQLHGMRLRRGLPGGLRLH